MHNLIHKKTYFLVKNGFTASKHNKGAPHQTMGRLPPHAPPQVPAVSTMIREAAPAAASPPGLVRPVPSARPPEIQNEPMAAAAAPPAAARHAPRNRHCLQPPCQATVCHQFWGQTALRARPTIDRDGGAARTCSRPTPLHPPRRACNGLPLIACMLRAWPACARARQFSDSTPQFTSPHHDHCQHP